MPKKLSKEQFIEKAEQVHNKYYDYSKVDYINSDTKVCIICPEHGEFWQTPHDHLGGHGCPSCGGVPRINTEIFINRAKQTHGDKYDYSKVEYINAKTKVCIICPEHGEFWQLPNDHIRGCKCRQCSRKSIGENKIKEILVKYNINFIYDKVSLKFLGRMRPDFYLPDYNLIIEYDGKQHFQQLFKDSKESYEQRLKYDKLKEQLCEDNGVKVLRIPYFEYNNIENILIKELKLQL